MLRKAVAIGGCLVGLIAVGVGPLAQVADASYGSATLSQSSAAPGGSLTVSGGGFAGNSTVTISIASTPTVIGTTTANASGAFTVTVTIPSSISPGVHTISASGVDPAGAPLVLTASITVTSSPTSPSGATSASGLPNTGTNVAIGVGAALILIALGGTMLLVIRKHGITAR